MGGRGGGDPFSSNTRPVSRTGAWVTATGASAVLAVAAAWLDALLPAGGPWPNAGPSGDSAARINSSNRVLSKQVTRHIPS